jgi:SAM-dependent methyltransferase
MTGYSFGDTELAAERLRVLDTVFASTTDALLAVVDAETTVAPRRVADLGCGPGATTGRLASRYPQAAVTGIDASEAFLTAARPAVPGATFVAADVTRPLPGAPFDLVFARFLLAHLPDVPAAIASWLAALAPGGVLVLEETEQIASTDPTFARYESLSDARVRAAGADVYAGRAISAAIPPTAEIVVDRVVPLDLTAGQAASMFWRNLATWGEDAVTDGLVTEPDRVTLLAALTARAGDDTRGLFTWTHHQTVLRRT